jgi:hypothetical protein
MRAGVVVPTIRGNNITEFLRNWENEFSDHLVIVIEDNPEKTFEVPGENVCHFCWRDIDSALGHDAWIIPRRTDCVRSFGYLKAYEEGVDMIVTLDDDCYPNGSDFLRQHYEKLSCRTNQCAWVSTGRGLPPRGMPYYHQDREVQCVINHGLWSTVPDLDAVTQVVNARLNQKFEPVEQVIPRGMFFPMCGMNLAFKPYMAPAMYFLLMGKDWPFDRFGDIWCGIFAKRICDHLGFAVCSGRPQIDHRRASNVWTNLRKESSTYEANETLWRAVDSVVLTKGCIRECYQELSDKLPLVGEYWNQLRTAMNIWADLFPKSGSERMKVGDTTDGNRGAE